MKKITMLFSFIKGFTCFGWNCYDYSHFFLANDQMIQSNVFIPASILIFVQKVYIFIFHNFNRQVINSSKRSKLFMLWYIFGLSVLASIWNIINKPLVGSNLTLVIALPFFFLFLLLELIETLEVSAKISKQVLEDKS